MNVWQQDSAWFRPTLSIDNVATILDIQPASVRRYLTDHDGFPEPADQRGNRNFWTPAAIYRHIWNAKPSRLSHIPRLCPLDDDIPAAQFVESEIIETRGLTYVLHTWEPGDRRGAVGVAYAKDFQYFDDESVWHLLALRPHLSAITLPKGTSRLRDTPHQPRLTVADHAGPDWYPWDIAWADLTALLQVDLPWWSYGLTDVDNINAWRPGAPLAQIRPHVRDITADHFERCRPLNGSTSDRAIAEIVDAVDRALATAFDLWPTGHDDLPNRPGLHHAAAAGLSPQFPQSVPPKTIRDALRHRIDDAELAVRAVDTARGFEVLLPAITHELLVVDPDTASPLAREWCHRLTNIGVSASPTEIGHHWVIYAMDQNPDQLWHDPLNDLVWAISTTSGTFNATLGTRMPAQGRIEELAIEDRRPFFRDSAGTVFPVPAIDGGTHRTTGSSATRLTAAILALMDNAARDIHRIDAYTDVLDTQATGLYDVICNSPGHVLISRAELEELRHETPQGAAHREQTLARIRPFRGLDNAAAL